MRIDRITRAAVAMGLAATVLVGGCSSDDDRANVSPTSTTVSTTTPGTSAIPATSAPLVDPVALRTTAVVDLGTEVTSAIQWPGRDSLLVTERDGRVRRLDRDGDGWKAGDVILDTSDRVRDTGGERGLLGLAVSPDTRWLFVSYTDGNDDGASVIDRYPLGDVAHSDKRTEILRIPQPFANHNGGDIVFGPDGLLYAGYGDGGGQGDPSGNGQNPDVLLGKMLRLDVLGAIGSDRPYTIPPANPFVSGGGRPEIFALGLRNPWRFSFDPADASLWIADVGGSEWEEVNHLPATGGPGTAGLGANLGWSLREGAHDTDKPGPRPAGLVDPVLEYSHDDGRCSVTGGLVVRANARVPSLDGWYLFSDYCDGVVRAVPANDPTAEPRVLVDLGGAHPASFARDSRGDVYVVDLDGRLLRLDPA